MKKISILLLAFLLVSCNLNNEDLPKEEIEDVVKEEKEDDTVNQKIKIDPSVDLINSNNESELLVAVHNNDIEKAIALIDRGANVNLQDNIEDSPYLYAGAQGRTEILEHMLKVADIDFTVVNRFGGNALIPAAEKGHLDNVKLLVADDRIDLDFQNNFGYTALIEAVALIDGSFIFQEIVRVLVDAGADVSIKDNYGKSALEYAQSLGYHEIEAILINAN